MLVDSVRRQAASCTYGRKAFEMPPPGGVRDIVSVSLLFYVAPSTLSTLRGVHSIWGCFGSCFLGAPSCVAHRWWPSSILLLLFVIVIPFGLFFFCCQATLERFSKFVLVHRYGLYIDAAEAQHRGDSLGLGCGKETARRGILRRGNKIVSRLPCRGRTLASTFENAPRRFFFFAARVAPRNFRLCGGQVRKGFCVLHEKMWGGTSGTERGDTRVRETFAFVLRVHRFVRGVRFAYL